MEYKYQALNAEQQEIRLLSLDHTKSSETELVWQVFHASLLDNPPPRYNAISYSWGRDTDWVLLHLDQGHVSVPRRAKDALQGVCQVVTEACDGEECMAFWIDAICIDQSNLPEKPKQVTLMTEIYSKAARTLIWLGSEPCCNPLAAFREVDLIYDYIRRTTKDFKTLEDHLWENEQEDQRRYRSSSLPMAAKADWKAVGRLFAQEWFMRLW